MSKENSGSRWRWLESRVGKAIFAGVILVSLTLVGLTAYVLLFKAPDSPRRERIRPRDGALIQERMQLFSWPTLEAFEYEFRLLDGGQQVIYFERTRGKEARLPFRLLEPGSDYAWCVHEIDEEGWMDPDALLCRSFRTAPAVTTNTLFGPLFVFPDPLTLGPEEMLSEMTLEISHKGPYKMKLPAELVFADGDKEYEASGTILAHFRLDAARASAWPGFWKPIEIFAGGRTRRIPVRPLEDEWLSFTEAVDTGFDPYRDTPTFANFEKSLFSKLTQGTCVGIALAVKLFFEKVDFGVTEGEAAASTSANGLLKAVLTDEKVVMAGSVDFRDLSEKRTGLVMDFMSLLHFENLNPANLTETIRAVLSKTEWKRTSDFIWRELREGRLPVVAGFRIRRKMVKAAGEVGSFAMLDSGHAFLVYKGWRFGSQSVFAVYDPNFEYDPAKPRRTLLIFHSDEGGEYHIGGGVEETMVRFLPLRSSRILTLLSIIAQGTREKARDTGQAFETLYHIWKLE